MVSFYVELMVVLLAAGCAIWEGTIYNELSTLTIIQLILSIVYFVLPMDYIFNCCLEVEHTVTDWTYEEKRH